MGENCCDCHQVSQGRHLGNLSFFLKNTLKTWLCDWCWLWTLMVWWPSELSAPRCQGQAKGSNERFQAGDQNLVQRLKLESGFCWEGNRVNSRKDAKSEKPSEERRVGEPITKLPAPECDGNAWQEVRKGAGGFRQICVDDAMLPDAVGRGEREVLKYLLQI